MIRGKPYCTREQEVWCDRVYTLQCKSRSLLSRHVHCEPNYNHLNNPCLYRKPLPQWRLSKVSSHLKNNLSKRRWRRFCDVRLNRSVELLMALERQTNDVRHHHRLTLYNFLAPLTYIRVVFPSRASERKWKMFKTFAIRVGGGGGLLTCSFLTIQDHSWTWLGFSIAHIKHFRWLWKLFYV